MHVNYHIQHKIFHFGGLSMHKITLDYNINK